MVLPGNARFYAVCTVYYFSHPKKSRTAILLVRGNTCMVHGLTGNARMHAHADLQYDHYETKGGLSEVSC